MGRIISLTIPENTSELLRKNAIEPDFRIFTDGMVSDAKQKDLVHMIGSSTERDLEGDTMSIKALQSMTKADKNMTVWLNHEYTLPDSIFGSVVGTPTIVHQDGIADLHLAVNVEMDNPNAVKVKKYIDNGRKLGCSIGCMVKEFEVPDDASESEWYQNPIIIHDVYVVEYSVVGIPANQRSWVENAIRGVFTRTFHPSLIPAMKSLWPRAFHELLETRELTEETKKYFINQPERTSSGKRLDWFPEKKQFLFTNTSGERFLSKDEVKTLFLQEEVKTPFERIKSLHENEVITEKKDIIPDCVKTACGSTSLPLDMDSSWDKGSAHTRVLEWAGGKDNFNKSKMKEVHFRVDGDGSNITDYHLPFADIKSGKPVAIWHAIIAAASALGGGRSGLTHEGDEEAIRSKIAHYYHKAGKPVPWKNEDKSMDQIETHEHDGIVHTHAKAMGFAVNKDGTPGVVVDAAGDHEAITGTHTHFHVNSDEKSKSILTPGQVIPVGDVLHIHEHSHDSDGTHVHVHVEGTQEGFKKPVGVQAADTDGDGDIDMRGGPSDSDLDSYGGARHLSFNEDTLKYQLEAYNSFGKLLGLPAITEEQLKQQLQQKDAFDPPYPDSIGGIPLPDHVQKGVMMAHTYTHAMTGGKVCEGVGTDGMHLTRVTRAPDGSYPIPLHPAHASAIQAAHDHTHALTGGMACSMGKTYSLEDITAKEAYGPGSGGGAVAPIGLPAHIQKRIQAIHDHMANHTGRKVCAAVGSDGQHLTNPAMAPDGTHPIPHHPDHAGYVQRIHDVTHKMTNGMSCGMGSTTHMNQTNFQDARNTLMDAEGQVTPDFTNNPLKSIESLVPAFDRTARALEAINTKAMQEEVALLKKELLVAKKGITQVYEETAKIASTVAALKNMPLGKPTMQQRSVTQQETTTTYEELTQLGLEKSVDTIEGVLAKTQIMQVKMPNGLVISYRKWGNGLGGAVGKGIRPELTSNQISLMTWDDIEAYRAGLAAQVPMIDDPEQAVDLW